jgi:hypothetical protein
MVIGMSSVRSLSLLRVQTSRESLARDQDMPSMTSSTSWLREMVQGMFPSLTRVQTELTNVQKQDHLHRMVA